MNSLERLSFFQRDSIPSDVVDESAQIEEQEAELYEIRCPNCRWVPGAGSRWCCLPCREPENFFGGCGTNWNTFDTRGHCPGCGHQWRWTICLSCKMWALHDDWYVKRNAR